MADEQLQSITGKLPSSNTEDLHAPSSRRASLLASEATLAVSHFHRATLVKELAPTTHNPFAAALSHV